MKRLFGRLVLEESDVRDVMPVRHESRSEADIPERPRKIIFTVNDWCKGPASITVSRRRLRRTVKIEKGDYLLFHVDETTYRRISPDEFDAITVLLLDQCGFESWDAEYRDPDVLDGIRWEISVIYDHRPDMVRCGSNAFPSCWNEVLTAFQKLAQEKG